MRKIILSIALLLLTGPAFAQDTYVNGYYRQNGTYVQPHYRSAPDGDTSNNWSTRGNVNPHTGQVGTRDPQPSTSSGGFANPGELGGTGSYGYR